MEKVKNETLSQAAVVKIIMAEKEQREKEQREKAMKYANTFNPLFNYNKKETDVNLGHKKI